VVNFVIVDHYDQINTRLTAKVGIMFTGGGVYTVTTVSQMRKCVGQAFVSDWWKIKSVVQISLIHTTL
jgi:hypothetical protein